MMSVIQFTTVVGPDGVIHPPEGVSLPVGPVEVIVRQGTSIGVSPEPAKLTYGWLIALAEEAELAKPDLPEDMAEHHDHYAHGKPR